MSVGYCFDLSFQIKQHFTFKARNSELKHSKLNTLYLYKQNAYGPNRSPPEKQFQSMDTFVQTYDYTICMLIEKKTLHSRMRLKLANTAVVMEKIFKCRQKSIFIIIFP